MEYSCGKKLIKFHTATFIMPLCFLYIKYIAKYIIKCLPFFLIANSDKEDFFKAFFVGKSEIDTKQRRKN